MVRTPRTRFALLGVLSLGPSSGYDIKQFVDEVLSYFWAESYGQIYPLLRKLQQEGLVERQTTRPRGKPAKHIYSLTDAGREELRRWLTEPAAPAPVRNELLLKVFFGRQTTLDVLKTHLQRALTDARRMVATLEQAEQGLHDENSHDADLLYWQLPLDLGLRVARARLQWCESSLHKLEDRCWGTEETIDHDPA